MTAYDHSAGAVIGATAYRLVNQYCNYCLGGWTFWVLYTAGGILSHLLLDIVPHHHPFSLDQKSDKHTVKNFCREALPGIAFVGIVFPLLLRNGMPYFLYHFYGILCANLIDVLALKFTFFREVNDTCHWFEKKEWWPAEDNGKKGKNGWGHYAYRITAIVWLYIFLF